MSFPTKIKVKYIRVHNPFKKEISIRKDITTSKIGKHSQYHHTKMEHISVIRVTIDTPPKFKFKLNARKTEDKMKAEKDPTLEIFSNLYAKTFGEEIGMCDFWYDVFCKRWQSLFTRETYHD